MAPPNKPGKKKMKKQPQSRDAMNKKRESKRNTTRKEEEEEENIEEAKKEVIDLSPTTTTIVPSDLQQLLLNIFKYALSIFPSSSASPPPSSEVENADLNTQIQILKTHLYNRDFDSAFTDASPALLRAYALRWSASRCLAYVGLFRGVVQWILCGGSASASTSTSGPGSGSGSCSEKCADEDEVEELGVLCIGGGAGAEIVALAGAWRVLGDEPELARQGKYEDGPMESVEGEENQGDEETGLQNLSLIGNDEQEQKQKKRKKKKKKLSITAVDIAEWSDVVHRLDRAIHSADIPGCKTCSSPLIHDDAAIDISFEHLDILTVPESDLKSLLSSPSSSSSRKERRTSLISLMFTLNELFSTSIPKTTKLLLRLTDLSSPGTVLLVVDSPGSYSTLSFSTSDSSSSASGKKQQQQQSSTPTGGGRQYPMKFLLDHTLLTVAEGKWEKLVSQDSRWFRRDVNSRLHYNVDLEGGKGFIKLEDMRFQIHVYRRLDS